MQRNRHLLFSTTTACAVSAFALIASAVDSTIPKTETAETAASAPRSPHSGQINGAAKASDIIGMAVKDKQDESIGKVENILVDLAAGSLVAVVVSTGDYLGLDGELSAVPPSALSFSKDRKCLQIDTTKALLEKAPHFKAAEWPDFTQTGYAADLHRAYERKPYLIPAGTTDPDNTARNKGDKAPTPIDQGNSKADITTTAQIRKEVMALDNLTLTAKNVKIITNEGKVTLRGPVNTAAEKKSICEIAERVAKADNVDDQIEVKLNSDGK